MDDTVYQIAKAVMNEWSFGILGAWYVIYVMGCRKDAGTGTWGTWLGVLREFSGTHGPLEPNEHVLDMARVLYYAEEGQRADTVYNLAFFDAQMHLDHDARGQPLRYYYVMSRQDVEAHPNWRPADLVVSLKDRDVLVTPWRGRPDTKYQLHLFTEAPWVVTDAQVP